MGVNKVKQFFIRLWRELNGYCVKCDHELNAWEGYFDEKVCWRC